MQALEDSEPPFDLIVVGGGINGSGIARDAAGRGLRVLLVEAEDLAGATSSASTKLIHGGLRYLEQFEFRLVREALQERETLMRAAPHLVWPLRFVLPHDPAVRPRWQIRAGLFLYDHLARRSTLPASRRLDLRHDPCGAPLRSDFTTGFTYSDCWVQDSRMVIVNALDAQARGATIAVRTRFLGAKREGRAWVAQIAAAGRTRSVRARAIVNAAGPWVASTLGTVSGISAHKGLRLVKGSHIVVPRLYAGAQAYLFQNPDKRVLFAIPYEVNYTLLGTTDIAEEGEPRSVSISEAEIRYICDAANRFLKKPVGPRDVVWSYAGVRPLQDDGAAKASVVTRDYVFDVDQPDGGAPILSVFGGKITTFRRLAEHALDALRGTFPGMGPAWTQTAVLPGGDLGGASLESFVQDLVRRRPFLPADVAARLVRTYGGSVDSVLGDATSWHALGRDFGGGLTEAEVDYLVRVEWAATVQDILWRRTRLGLVLKAAGTDALTHWLAGATRTRVASPSM